MPTPPVVLIGQTLNLLTSLLSRYVERAEPVEKIAFERFFLYCIAWGICGLHE